MSRKKRGGVLRSLAVLLVCAAVLALLLKDYLLPFMEGWEIKSLIPAEVWNWLLWAIDLRETP